MKGDKTMRRHVETQIENPEKERLGIIIFFAVWVLALLVLTASARGEEVKSSPMEINKDAAQPAQKQSSPKPQPTKAKESKAAGANENKAQQPDSGDEQ